VNGFTKLFGSLITSTVWSLPDSARVVWITMLALADQDGYVAASVPGLAKVAGVSREACDHALALFLAPDPDSRTQEHEGRRVLAVDGGWSLLNHGKYRDLQSAEDRRSKDAARQAKVRERRRVRDESRSHVTSRDASLDVTESHASHTMHNASASASGVVPESGSEIASPPDWWASVLAVVQMATGEDLPADEAWLRYDGHRHGKGIAANQRDAQYWLTTVMVSERRKARDDAHHREKRDADFDRKRAQAKDPPKPPQPTREQSKAMAEQLAARVRAGREKLAAGGDR
jgi:hypothetical protein